MVRIRDESEYSQEVPIDGQADVFVDTSFLIELLREQNAGREGAAKGKLMEIRADRLQFSVFVLCELQAGARQSRNPQDELARVDRLVEYLEVVYPAQGFAVMYGEIEFALRQ